MLVTGPAGPVLDAVPDTHLLGAGAIKPQQRR